MGVSKEALYQVITDFKSYPEFVTEVVSVEVQPGATKQTATVKFELEIVKRFQYTLSFKFKENEEVYWELVESNFFKTNTGRWLLKDAGAGNTDATYELDVAVGFLIPGWISKKLTETSLPRMMEGFEERTKKVKKK